MAISKSKIIAISVFIISFVVFYAGFRYNTWQVLKNGKFLDNQAESLVVGRLVKSAADGITSSGGLCGRCYNQKNDTALFENQYRAFLNNESCKKYVPYLSQIGFHAMVYFAIDKASPFKKSTDLQIMYAFKSGMLAMVMSFIVLWFLLELGLLPAIFVSAGILLTPWFTFLGRDLWFCIWTNFLPFLAALFILRQENRTGKLNGRSILLIVSLVVLFSFIYNGFEWVTTTLIMTAVPFFYYWRMGQWPFARLAKRIGWLVAGSLASVMITFSILIYQIAQVKGTISKGIEWLIFSFQKRTYGGGEDLPEVFEKQIDHSIWEVFLINLGGVAFPFPAFISQHVPRYFGGILFAEILFILLIITFLIFYRRNFLKIKEENRKWLQNLSIVTWISLLAPFSWFVIFKGHAWSHHHINYITWWMPFGLFVMALLGSFFKVWVANRFIGSEAVSKALRATS